MIEVELSLLSVLPDLQVRAKTDPATVRRYANAMKAGAAFPPITVAELDGVLVLLDGFHRREAMASLSVRRSAAQLVTARTFEDARWKAAQANLQHGRPYSRSEVREAFRAYVGASQHRHGGRRRGTLKSYREMGADLGQPHTTLRNWMRRDFPTVFRALADGGEGVRSLGDLPNADTPSVRFEREANAALDAVAASLPGVTDPVARGLLLAKVDDLRAALLAAGIVEEQPF